jgi:hypothetical protein
MTDIVSIITGSNLAPTVGVFFFMAAGVALRGLVGWLGRPLHGGRKEA